MTRTRTSRNGLVLGLLLATCGQALANVNLEWRPDTTSAPKCSIVHISLYAVSDVPGQNQPMSAMDVVFSWDPNVLELQALTSSPSYWLASGFPQNDPYGLNEAPVPADGDGLYSAFAQLGTPVNATPAGTLVTTFRFAALRPSSGTVVQILPMAGSPPGETVVYDGVTPNTPVTGTLGSATVEVLAETCLGDLNGDCFINITDLGILLAHFGDLAAPPEDGDLNGDMAVNIADLGILLSVFGTSCF